MTVRGSTVGERLDLGGQLRGGHGDRRDGEIDPGRDTDRAGRPARRCRVGLRFSSAKSTKSVVAGRTRMRMVAIVPAARMSRTIRMFHTMRVRRFIVRSGPWEGFSAAPPPSQWGEEHSTSPWQRPRAKL